MFIYSYDHDHHNDNRNEWGSRRIYVSSPRYVFFCISFYFTNIIYSQYNTTTCNRRPTMVNAGPQRSKQASND